MWRLRSILLQPLDKPVDPNKTASGGIRIEGLRKVYGQGDTAVEALKNVNMVVGPGEVAVSYTHLTLPTIYSV